MIGTKTKVIKWMVDQPEGDYEVKPYKKRRSLNANGLLWSCIDKIADKLRTDKWDVYLLMLKRYGKFTYIIVPNDAVEKTLAAWREAEVVGTISVNGRDATQLLCYYGSSLYDTAEFARLLDGVISEMKEMEIPTPSEEEAEKALARWAKLKGES